METALATIDHGKCKAEIFETALPGQFLVRYYDSNGNLAVEDELTGISTYKQREQEITERLKEVCEGGRPSGTLADAGEY